MNAEIETLLLRVDATVRQAIACIDGSHGRVALVVDPERRLVGTVTDGDVRRAMLAEIGLDVPVRQLLERQQVLGEERPFPLTAPAGTAAAELATLMRRWEVRQIPLVDDEGRPVDVAFLDDMLGVEAPRLRAVVMAGGFGTRLGPLTKETPKPMLPVGDRPLLERIIGQLRDAGIHHVNLTTHYREETIAAHFGDGREFGVEIEYVAEQRPLGTAGALGLVEADGPILVMNGDILTQIDFRAMHRFHDEHRAEMTVAVRPYEVRVPYGLVELEGEVVTGIGEKPLLHGFVNAGIYLIDPEVCSLVPPGEPLEMPQLIDELVARGRRVVGFPLREYWLDIGQVADYEQALTDVESM